jgi:hypothetical protein
LAIHGIRVWHTRALENLAGPFRSVHPLALGGGTEWSELDDHFLDLTAPSLVAASPC